MKKFVVVGMVASLLNLAVRAEEVPEEVIEGEGEIQEPAAPVRYTATIKPGGTKTYTNPEHWDTGKVPDGYHVDIRIDGDPTVATKLDIIVPNGVAFTNGSVTVDADDSLVVRINDKAGNGHWWYSTCITNNGSFEVSGSNGKNDQKLNAYAYEAPSYFGQDSITKVSDGRQGCTHSLELMTDGTVNDGRIEASVSGAQYLRTYLYFHGDGVFTNNGFIDAYTTGNYTSTKPGEMTVKFIGNVVLDGDGVIQIDNDRRMPGATFSACLQGNGYDTYLTNGVNHTVQGNGWVGNAKLCNYGLIRALGTNTTMAVHITGMREHRYVVTNNVTGRIVADGPSGLEFKNNSRPGWNTHFVNLGLLEARSGSCIRFADGVNSTSTQTGDSNLPTTSSDYLKLWGRIAGGGLFRTIRPIHIMEGAKLMPGDLANDDGTGESTHGVLSFATNLVLEAGAITEFQCRKPVEGKYDSVWVDGDATVAGTLRFLEQPKAGTYPLFTSTGTLTCDLAALKIELADGVRAPKLKVVDGQRLEATWTGGFTVFVR